MIFEPLPPTAEGATIEYALGLTHQGPGPDLRHPTVIYGDPGAFRAYHERYNRFSQPYSSYVLSWRESIPDDEATLLVISLLECLAPGARPGQFAVLAVRHHEPSKELESRTAVHLFIGHTNLFDAKGKRFQPYWPRAQGRHLQSWVTLMNLLKGYSQPSDASEHIRVGVKAWPNREEFRTQAQGHADSLLPYYNSGSGEVEVVNRLKLDGLHQVSATWLPDHVLETKFAANGYHAKVRFTPAGGEHSLRHSRIKDILHQHGVARTPQLVMALREAYTVEHTLAAHRFAKRHGGNIEAALEDLSYIRDSTVEILCTGLPKLIIDKLKAGLPNAETAVSIRPMAPPLIEPSRKTGDTDNKAAMDGPEPDF